MSTSTVTHIVLFRYRSDLTWSDFERHFEDFKALKDGCKHPTTGRPYILSMKMGRNTSWEPFNKGMTHGFVLEFASQSDLDYYLLEDPLHLQFSRDAKPFVEDSVVVDIRDGALFSEKAIKPGTNARAHYRGKCHCGELEWVVQADEELTHVLCHCDTCKRLGGGPYSCNYIVPRENLAITRGKPGHYAYKGASGKEVHCYFCSTCTSHVYHHQDAMPEKVIVRTLLLDGGNRLKKGGEIFEEGQLSWVRDLDEALTPPGKKASKMTNGA
ncbi:Hypothetical protein D9617_17g046450 [Elsinoe fawcettii]|nr:Hypothetical protein D9617_17g046450 [Elsinoe fawcettii]